MRLAKQIAPEDKKTPRRMSLRGYLFSFLALCFILGSGIIIIQWSTIKTGFHHQIAETGFKLETVKINGRNHTTHQELNDALKLQNGEPILSINLTKKRLQIEQLGWVESAHLERLLPNTLRLTIIERTPIALLQTKEGHQLIDDNEVQYFKDILNAPLSIEKFIDKVITDQPNLIEVKEQEKIVGYITPQRLSFILQK